MDDKVIIYLISSDYAATKLITVHESIYHELSENFKPKNEQSKFIVTRQYYHQLNETHKYYSYSIYDSNFLPLEKLNGIYKLPKNVFKETWEGQWINKIFTLAFESDIFDRYEVKISSQPTKLKTIQQIAFVLEAIDNRSIKLSAEESAELRLKLDNYINVKKI